MVQMQVVGKCYYGKKVMFVGGGGGWVFMCELFDILLVWKFNVMLDVEGWVQLDVLFNDVLIFFCIVVIVENGISDFGIGSISICFMQDVQVIFGLLLLVCEGDNFNGSVIVCNIIMYDMMIKVVVCV